MANHRRRYLSLVLFAGLWVAGGSWPVLGAAAATGLLGLTAVRLRRRRAAARSARLRAGSERAAAEHGIVLGAEPSGRPVQVTDRQLGAHALIVGASGAGKSTTLMAILADQIERGCPVVAIDMKGSPPFAGQLRAAAHAAGRELRIWSPDGPGHWNPLAHGNATALKDKLISTERFSEPHYQRAAERYVQTALQVLQAAHPDRAVALEEVVAAMEPRRLAKSLRAVPQSLADRVQDYLSGLTADQLSAARGLGTRLAILSESSAGGYLAGGPPTSSIDLGAALEGGDVVLFSLNSSVYGKLAAQLGALAIQDLVSAAGRRLETLGDTSAERPEGLRDAPGRSPGHATVAIDEFSALGADNVLALLARGREAGVSVLLATQELVDLERAGAGFRDQVLGNTAVKIVHRQEVPDSARTVARMAGTHRVWDVTEQIRGFFPSRGASHGSRRQVDEFVVHPNEIMRLQTGQAILLSKTPVARVVRVVVRAPRLRAIFRPTVGPPQAPPVRPPQAPPVRPPQAPAVSRPPARREGARREPGRGRDQPPPGVTR
jgi:hypothetical protein